MSSPDNTTDQGESEGDAGRLDAPNQQVVRPDQSGPADEGTGGSGREPEQQQDREGSEPTRLATPDEQATQQTPPAPRKGRGRGTGRRDDDT